MPLLKARRPCSCPDYQQPATTIHLGSEAFSLQWCDDWQQWEKKSRLSLDRHHIDFLCGWAAGCIETCTLFPSNKVIFRQQLHGFSAREAWSQYPVRFLCNFLHSAATSYIQSTLRCPHSPPNTSFTLCHAQAAFLAGICEASLCPLERVQVLLQTSAFHDRFKNTGETLLALRAFGYREYYRGISVVVLRNSLSNALFFTLREPFKKASDVIKSSAAMFTKRFVLSSYAHFCFFRARSLTLSVFIFIPQVLRILIRFLLSSANIAERHV
ncbi:unnamed protein product [Strongylus vulgaris]|uniref:Uncharacterized protein n=1 Tax=Strongylus vulgaris TaxID=40348 RepID=A0A3P7J3P5_STRVU|nr:unnamed protein product [Strongylus vulgaris]